MSRWAISEDRFQLDVGRALSRMTGTVGSPVPGSVQAAQHDLSDLGLRREAALDGPRDSLRAIRSSLPLVDSSGHGVAGV